MKSRTIHLQITHLLNISRPDPCRWFFFLPPPLSRPSHTMFDSNKRCGEIVYIFGILLSHTTWWLDIFDMDIRRHGGRCWAWAGVGGAGVRRQRHTNHRTGRLDMWSTGLGFCGAKNETQFQKSNTWQILELIFFYLSPQTPNDQISPFALHCFGGISCVWIGMLRGRTGW